MTIDKSGSVWLPHVRAAVVELDRMFPTTSAGTYPGHDPTPARAVDFMIPRWNTNAGKAVGNALAGKLSNVATMKRLGGWYVIWNERIWSMTRPDSGWIQYRPTAAAVKRSPASAYHRNHVHLSFYPEAPEPVKPPTYLPRYIVDPAKVSTFLYGWKDGEDPKKRPPGFKITTGVKIILRTESGWEYDMDYLKLDDETA